MIVKLNDKVSVEVITDNSPKSFLFYNLNLKEHDILLLRNGEVVEVKKDKYNALYIEEYRQHYIDEYNYDMTRGLKRISRLDIMKVYRPKYYASTYTPKSCDCMYDREKDSTKKREAYETARVDIEHKGSARFKKFCEVLQAEISKETQAELLKLEEAITKSSL